MKLEKCRSASVYSPLGEPVKFVVHFDSDPMPEQQVRAARAIAHLETLNEHDLTAESHKFYKWIVLYTVSVCHIHYTVALLEFFHGKGMLRCKQRVNNVTRQDKTRYLVVFSLGDHVFSQTYNSIRELKADTGRKPSQIKPQLTEYLLCQKM